MIIGTIIKEILKEDFKIINYLNTTTLKLKTLILLIALLCVGLRTTAQRVYVAKTLHEASLKVYTTKYPYQADITITQVNKPYLAGHGKWYYVKHRHQADISIYFVKYPYQADIRIFIKNK